MYCRNCGTKFSESACPKCNRALSRDRTTEHKGSEGRLWIIMGVACMILGLFVVVGAIWFVENRRTNSVKDQPTSTPITTQASNSSTETSTSEYPEFISTGLNLLTMNRDDLIKLLPAYAVSRYKSESGRGKPDNIKILIEGEDQYVVMLGSENKSKDKRELFLSVFKLDGQQLVDNSKNSLPQNLPNGRIGNELTEVTFSENGRAIKIANPLGIYGTELIKECPVCEHAYMVQELTWSENSFKASPKIWRNDPYSVCYATAQALDKKEIDSLARPCIEQSLDSIIKEGLDRQTDRPWSLQKSDYSNTQENPNQLSYILSNSLDSLTITVNNIEGRWQTTGLKRN